MRLPIWSLSLVCCISGWAHAQSNASAPAAQPASIRQDVTIPFELVNKNVYIQVSIDGSRPFWFVLDTGDKYAVVDLNTAKSLGVSLGDQVSVGGGGEHVIMGNFVKNGSFRVKGLDGFAQPLFIAIPLDDLAKVSGHEFAGILGFDFISQFAIEIDYIKKTLTLHDKANYQYRGDGESFPISFNAAGHPQIKAAIVDNGIPIEGLFTLDIGSAASVILNSPFAKKQGLPHTGQQTVPWLEGFGFGGDIAGTVGRLNGIKLGGFLIEDPVVVFSQTESGPLASPEAQGNLGAAILEKFRIILDYERKRLILESNAKFPEPLEYNRSGLFLEGLGNDYKTFRIRALADHSPASEAELKVGDELITINGQPAADYTLSQLRDMLQRAAECDLAIRRDGHDLPAKLKLRRLI